MGFICGSKSLPYWSVCSGGREFKWKYTILFTEKFSSLKSFFSTNKFRESVCRSFPKKFLKGENFNIYHIYLPNINFPVNFRELFSRFMLRKCDSESCRSNPCGGPGAEISWINGRRLVLISSHNDLWVNASKQHPYILYTYVYVCIGHTSVRQASTVPWYFLFWERSQRKITGGCKNPSKNLKKNIREADTGSKEKGKQ